MLLNHLKIAWRSLLKDRFYALINILGLAIATAAFLLIINFVKFEYSYEDFHEHADDIYRITLDLYKGSEYVVTDCETHPPLAPRLKKEMPEVVDYVRMQRLEEISEIRNGNDIFRVDGVYAADPSVFSVFNYTFIEGKPSLSLHSPLQAVLTETLARKMFGSVDVIGRTLRNGDRVFTVTGVIRDVPLNTHLKFELLISFSTLEKMGYDLNSWNGNNNYTYVQLLPHADLNAFNAKLKALSKERLQNKMFVAEPVKDIHLHSHKTFEPEVNGDIKVVQFLLIAAVLILLVGSVNYVNLTTARAAERVKETGIRKVLGSSRILLVKQFLTETFLINVLALACSLLIIKLVQPAYLQLIGRPVTMDFFSTFSFWGICLSLFLFNCLLSGLYPSVVLSSVKPVAVTTRTFTMPAKGNLLRKALVVGQFAAALIVLSVSFIVYRQISYLRNQDLGMNTMEVLVIRSGSEGTDSVRRLQSQAFINELMQVKNVEKVAVSGSLPGVSLHKLGTTTGLTRFGEDADKGYNFYLYGIDAAFIPTMEIKLAAGRNFRENSENKDEMIISRTAAKLLGFRSPEDAVGKGIAFSGDKKPLTVVGVVEDYHQQSLKGSLLPMVHWYSNDARFFSVKLNTVDLRNTVAQIGEIWKRQYPGYPFEYQFLNELFDQQYKADQQFGKISEIFSVFTLFITCLGILGLMAYNISRRKKEISIRKVLGASVASIVTMLSGDFIRLVIIAVFIATPLAWYLTSQWLQGFAYRIQVQWWMFGIIGLLTTIIALVAISFQSVRAALVNPVSSLRSDA